MEAAERYLEAPGGYLEAYNGYLEAAERYLEAPKGYLEAQFLRVVLLHCFRGFCAHVKHPFLPTHHTQDATKRK